MSKPYNFFGTSESGTTGNGIISAYSGFFSGFYTPEGMFKTPNGFIFVTEDEVYTPTQINTVFSGFFSSTNLHECSLQNSFNGAMFPVSAESGELSFRATGSQVKDNIDYPTYISVFSGNVGRDIIDIPSLTPNFTGRFPKSQVEVGVLYQSFTGIISPQFTDYPSINLSFSGNIVKYETDSLLLNGNIDYLEWKRGNPQISTEQAETGNLLFGLDFICWSRGGC